MKFPNKYCAIFEWSMSKGIWNEDKEKTKNIVFDILVKNGKKEKTLDFQTTTKF